MLTAAFVNEFNAFAEDCPVAGRSKLDPLASAIEKLRQKGYSFRKIAGFLIERGFKIAHTTIWYWWKRLAGATQKNSVETSVKPIRENSPVRPTPTAESGEFEPPVRQIPRIKVPEDIPRYILDIYEEDERRYAKKVATGPRIAAFRRKYNRTPKSEEELIEGGC